MPPKIDLTGQKFHRLTVLAMADTAKQRTRWKCACACGSVVVVGTDDLRKRTTKSCGCWKAEQAGMRAKEIMRTHGGSKLPIYKVWSMMRQRCSNPNSHKYPQYGGRGIKVCEQWQDFALFLADMGERPSAQHSLDRIDSNGDYEPGNVRWATQREQQNNRRDNRLLTVNGQTKTSSEWGRDIGVNPNLVRQRIDRDGVSPLEALGIGV